LALLPRLPQCNRNWFGATNKKLLLAFLLCFSALIAQDPTSYLTPEVARVGDRLACRCGGCRNTVGNCPMLHCHSADPKRQLIHEMQKAGLSDDAIVNTFVREEGVVALSSPPSGSLGGLITWVMPGVALPVSGTLRSGDLVVLHTFALLIVVVTTSLFGYARESRVDADFCVFTPDLGCIHGSVADEAGKPLKGIQIDLLPTDKSGDDRWDEKKTGWTDSQGRYSVARMTPGDYLVAIHYYSAPDARQPFATTFYPGVEVESNAQRVSVRQNSPTMLAQLKLRSLPLENVRVDVLWSDGTRPRTSSLLFHNPKYPDQAVIGDEALSVVDGAGEFAIPAGFSYLARASLQRDAGAVIETRESGP
jgi:cytochrome c-type biogenesis protein CcmH/NrfF